MSAYLSLDGLPSSISEEDLSTLFSDWGSVLSVQILHTLGRETPGNRASTNGKCRRSRSGYSDHEQNHTRRQRAARI